VSLADPVVARSRLAAAAISSLGWCPGTPVDVELFGTHLVVAVEPDPTEIARRRDEGLTPLADAWQFRLRVTADPGFLTRPAPVRLIGAIAARASWPSARSATGLFTAFGAGAALIPAQACTPVALAEAAVTGVGVVVRDGSGVRVLAAARVGAGGCRSHVHRLVEEIVWNAFGGLGSPLPVVP
jgi:hypothetical protein